MKQGTLSTGSRTKVKGYHGTVYILTDHMRKEHGRGVLHIISPGMEKGIKRKGRPLGQIIPVGTPRDLLIRECRYGCLGRIKPNRDRGVCGGKRSAKLLRNLTAPLLLHQGKEIGW
jgi:hypothetical protein